PDRWLPGGAGVRARRSGPRPRPRGSAVPALPSGHPRPRGRRAPTVNDEQGSPGPELRRPDPGLRGRRRESGSSVLPGPVSPPPVADSFSPDAAPASPGSAAPEQSTPPGGGTGTRTRDSSDASVMRSTGSMAVANLASRITGFVRMILILTVLGPAVASAFNTANTLPNMITELVLG